MFLPVFKVVFRMINCNITGNYKLNDFYPSCAVIKWQGILFKFFFFSVISNTWMWCCVSFSLCYCVPCKWIQIIPRVLRVEDTNITNDYFPSKLTSLVRPSSSGSSNKVESYPKCNIYVLGWNITFEKYMCRCVHVVKRITKTHVFDEVGDWMPPFP